MKCAWGEKTQSWWFDSTSPCVINQSWWDQQGIRMNGCFIQHLWFTGQGLKPKLQTNTLRTPGLCLHWRTHCAPTFSRTVPVGISEGLHHDPQLDIPLTNACTPNMKGGIYIYIISPWNWDLVGWWQTESSGVLGDSCPFSGISTISQFSRKSPVGFSLFLEENENYGGSHSLEFPESLSSLEEKDVLKRPLFAHDAVTHTHTTYTLKRNVPKIIAFLGFSRCTLLIRTASYLSILIA